jgi:nanoRNase/pAp phosphatase (c-di-AMP/oligoRNAs hydrolase)
VQTHDNPDPDCIGSAVALRYLLERYGGIPVTVAHGGTVGRSENRAMLRHLRVKPAPASRTDYAKFDLVCLVDCQPSTGYASLPEGVVPQVVFDHHPSRGAVPGATLVEIDESAGSTCTLLGEMLVENGVPIPQEVATALVYGIKAETQDLGRETGPRDERVYTSLYPLANKRLLSRIQMERLPRRWFQDMQRCFAATRIHGDVALCDLGEVRVPDIVPEAADLLLRLERMRWSCVLGAHGSKLYFSLRAADASQRADRALRRALRGMGACGGHGAMAGGQIPLDGMTADERAAAAREFAAGVLAGLHADRRSEEPLLPPAGPSAGAAGA